jgi:hypothetical protein
MIMIKIITPFPSPHAPLHVPKVLLEPGAEAPRGEGIIRRVLDPLASERWVELQRPQRRDLLQATLRAVLALPAGLEGGKSSECHHRRYHHDRHHPHHGLYHPPPPPSPSPWLGSICPETRSVTILLNVLNDLVVGSPHLLTPKMSFMDSFLADSGTSSFDSASSEYPLPSPLLQPGGVDQ